MSGHWKKTPKDATDFEREQLRFFLTIDDVVSALASVNPSLAWLPILAEMQLIKTDTQLAPWIEKNFSEADAVRDVAANIRFFGPDSADILEFRLNCNAEKLSPLLLECWRLIIRHMRTAKRGTLQSDWFEIAPRIKRGEQSTELLERLAYVLKPKLEVGKKLYLCEGGDFVPERPSDLMSIDYEVETGISDEEVLAVWPEDASVEIEKELLVLLSHALSAVIKDAVEIGVESNRGHGISDIDVPSVAKHPQNAYHNGFLPIVRVVAELWTRLAEKNLHIALPFVDLWAASQFRLIRRLALFAAANAAVPADKAADILLNLPQGELFLTNSSVEVYRLMLARWRELIPAQREKIDRRIAEGPPTDWFREGADVDLAIDRHRFDLLGSLQRDGFELSAHAQAVLRDIRERFPRWELRPPEQAGFHIWHGGVREIVGDPDKLRNVPDDQLVAEAKRLADETDFFEGDNWQTLCQGDPERALRGLESQAKAGCWPASAWAPFLWAGQRIQDPESVTRIAQLLLEWPKDQFSQISSDASWWLNEKAKRLDDNLLWPLWDRIEEALR